MHFKNGNRATVIRRQNRWGNPLEKSDRAKRTPLISKVQFDFETLYISPFSRELITDERGFSGYTDIEKRSNLTGINIFDDYLNSLGLGQTNQASFCKRHGIRVSDLNVLTFVLTGIEGLEFRIRWMMRTADLLLKHTDLNVTQVARLTGMGGRLNIYFHYQRQYNCTPTDYRERNQRRADLKHFQLREEWKKRISALKK